MNVRIPLAVFFVIVLGSCGNPPLKLVCKSIEPFRSDVAFEIDEKDQTAKQLDPISLQPIGNAKFVDVYFSPTVINMNIEGSSDFWLLDRTTGKLRIKSTGGDYYCLSGRRF